MPAGRNRVRIIGGDGAAASSASRLRPRSSAPPPTGFARRSSTGSASAWTALACLDLFAGSGALGFEALSRGAARVVMVERDRPSRRRFATADASWTPWVRRSSRATRSRSSRARGDRFDVVFLDPPYATRSRGAGDARAARAAQAGRAGLCRDRAAPIAPAAPWQALREGRAGAVRYALFGTTPHDHHARRLPRHLRPDHQRPRGPHPARLAALPRGGGRRRPQPGEAAVLLARRARVARARGARRPTRT